jgi:hypothetical protein
VRLSARFCVLLVPGVLTAAIAAGQTAAAVPGRTVDASPAVGGGQPAGAWADLSSALGTDGTFRGSAGLVGTVDTQEWALVSDVAAGTRPRLARRADAHPRTATPTGPWSALGSDGSGDGALNGWTAAIAVSGRDLYVGGAFTNAGGHAGANHIAKWNGSAWSAVGPALSIDDQVDAIAILGGDLYIGGRFTDAGGDPKADYIARWDGSDWSALGSDGNGGGALNDWVRALAVSDTDLYVGGDFTNAGSHAKADFVARWNGTAWSALGSNAANTNGAIGPSPDSPSASVFALAASGNDLYVGGVFLDAAGIPYADDIAKWDGSAWSALGSRGDDGAILGPAGVYALAMSGTDLYAGGSFQDLGSTAGDNIAMWDGSTWHSLGTWPASTDGAINHNVHSLAVSGPDLYVGGEFHNAEDIPAADRIARWDGSHWSALGSNGSNDGALNDEVDALVVPASDSGLVVAGTFFDAAGEVTADHIAWWGARPVIRRPDGRIRVGIGSLVGNGVYNTTAAGQSRTGSAPAGSTISFGISIQNDGTGGDQYLVKATGRAVTGYSVKYFSGTTDITAAVVAGTYRTASIAPLGTSVITARVTVKSSAAVGSQVTRLVTITSVGDSTKKDAVSFTGKRR